MRNFRNTAYILILITLLFSGCATFVGEYESNSSSIPQAQEKDDVISKIYSNDPYKDEIMRFFKYNNYTVRESSIKRVSNWVDGPRYELPVKKGVAIVYFLGYKIVAIRDKSNLNYIFGGPSYF